MKKTIIIVSIAILLVGGGIGAYLLLGDKDSTVTATKTSVSTTPAQELGQPTRPAELKGTIKSIEGNEVIIMALAQQT